MPSGSYFNEIPETFEEAGLKNELVQHINTLDITVPLPLQQQILRPILSGRDVLIEANHYTGLTTALILGSLHRVNANNTACQAMIIASTRELACSIHREVQRLGSPLNIQSNFVFGGQPMHMQMNILRQGMQIIVGTLNRINDLIERGALYVDDVSYVAFDETDAIFSTRSLGRQDARNSFGLLAQRLPDSVQIVYTGGPMCIESQELAENILKEPVHIKYQSNEYYPSRH